MLRLTRERLRQGLSKAALARRAGLDQGLMSKIELRRVVPYPGQVAKLAGALKIPAEAVMSEVEDIVY